MSSPLGPLPFLNPRKFSLAAGLKLLSILELHAMPALQWTYGINGSGMHLGIVPLLRGAEMSTSKVHGRPSDMVMHPQEGKGNKHHGMLYPKGKNSYSASM
ncbi:hypothetical protein JAAARDRAFT_448343 [Jaapia argillacea MUCL 33604]|uniref:Uncharacterized protein n=1 Tax=Jaapia argillacea MUCL 33604 TaxID=933084 RepID=A0A067Q517_9AGAM|nr:hypothetical protein JAAARDRAFT_448343 [Jaapia argillacea MUCL 33604]